MGFFSNLSVSLLFALTPFAIGALLVPVLCRSVPSSLPRSFLVSHLVISLLIHPFLDIAAKIWLFLPVYLLLTAVPAVASLYVTSAVFFVLSNLFRDVTAAGSRIKDTFGEFNPFDIKMIIRESIEDVFISLEAFFEDTDFTEMFQAAKPPVGDSWHSYFKGYGGNVYEHYNFSEAIRNITISESTQQHIDSINAATIGLLENIEVSNFFNTTRIPFSLHTPLDAVSEAFRNLAEHLNFSEMLKEVTVPPDVQDSIDNLAVALNTLHQNFSLTELLETVSASKTEEALEQIKDPSWAFQSFWKSAGTSPTVETVNAFFSWVPIDLHVASGVYILLLLFGIPCLFILRAALQDGSQWLVTRRYESEIPSAQRSALGWMFVGSTSGLASAAGEAFPYCCFWFYLYNSNALSAVSLVVLVVHTLTAVPVRAASQMRIAEANARRDVLKDSRPGVISGFVMSALTNGTFNIWWLCFSCTVMISRVTLWLPGLFIMADAIVVCFVIFWGRRICQRILSDEQRRTDDRERKRE